MHKTLLFIFVNIYVISFSQNITLVYPNDKFINSDSVIVFKWNNTCCDSSLLQISKDSLFNNIVLEVSNITSNNFTIDTFSTHTRYYWRIKNQNTNTYSNIRSFQLFSPNDINSIGLWLDADSSNIIFESGKIKEWYDLSPNNNNLYQTDNSLQPFWRDSIINNKPCIYFPSSLNYLSYTDTIDTLGGTLFTIVKNTNSNGSYFIGFSEYTNGPGLFFDNDNSYFWFNGNRHCNISFDNDTNFALVSVKQDTTQYGDYWQSYYAKIKVNQNVGDSISTYGYHLAMNWLGTTNWYGGKKQCTGYMPELIYYHDPLNDSLYNLNEQYLRYKYAPPVNLSYDIHIPYGFCDTTIDAGARFTSYLWNTGDTTQTITVNQSGAYSVTVTDIFGFESSDTIMVYYPEPVQITDTAICLGDTLLWNCGMDSTYHFQWSTGNTTDQIQIWQQGYYYLQITDSFGCNFFTDTIFVKIDSFPQTASLGNDTSLCAGVNITLATGNASAVSYIWSTTDTTQYITINAPGTYAITVTDTLGCVAKDTVQIDIHGQAPIPNFTWQNICLGDNTMLNDSSYTTDNSNITSWQWQLPDTLLSIQNITYSFSDTGSFPIILTISTDSNCSNTIQKQITIHPLPVSDFFTTQLCSNTPINFTDNINSVDSIIYYQWNFGDGMTDSIPSPVHQFSTAGDFPVSLNITSLFECKDSISKTLEIKPSPGVDFSHSILCASKQTQFNDLSITSPIFPIINWNWNFGDGITSILSNPIHIYSDTGTYVVSLTAQSLNGCRQTKTDTVIVYPSPQTYFLNDTICAKTMNQFTDSTVLTNDSISNWFWYIDNSLQSTDQNPQFYFQNTGTYLISLIAQSSHQCRDSISKTITVFAAPSSDFSFYPEIGTPNYSLSFTTDSDLIYDWDFGDNFSSTEQNPQHLFTDSGSYTVTLITTNSFECHDTTEKTILIVNPVYDIAIINFTTTQIGNYLSFACQFLDIGSLPLDSVMLTLQIQDAPHFMEKWIGHILPGEIVSYQFSTNYQINSYIPEVTCVEVTIPGQTDPTPENNLKCNNTTDNFIFYTIYPNPADNTLYLEFNNPKVQTVNIQIIDKLGKIVLSDKLEQIDKGFQRIKANVSQLESGTYTIKIFTNIDTQEKQFMVY